MNIKSAQVARRGGLMALLATMALAVAGPATAIEHGFYIAGDYDSNRFDRDSAGFDAMLEPFLECQFAPDPYSLCSDSNFADVVLAPTSFNKKAKGYGFWVGYQFSHWFAVEGSYLDMGSTHYLFGGTIDLGPVDVDGDGVTDFDGPQQLSGNASFRTRGPAIAAVGSVELGDYFSLDARAGLFFSDNKLDLNFAVTTPSGAYPFPYNESTSKTALFYGVSGTFWITPYFGLRGGVNAYQKGSFRDDVKQYFAGIRYSYGY